MRRRFIILLFFLLPALNMHAQGNHVFSGGEFTNYNIVDIATWGGQTWSTDRVAMPGYFSVVNTANFTGCSDAANINGYVKKYGNNNFIFPVGNGGDIRTLEISAPATPSDTYATAWIPGEPGGNMDPTAPNAGAHPSFAVAAPIAIVSTVGQWDWQVGDAGNLGIATTGTGAGLTITVSIPDMTTFALAANLRLVGWNGTHWVDLSGGPTATGTTENSLLSGVMLPGITAVAIGSVAWTLPLKLISLNATASNCDAMITWVTSDELNTDKFIIEQSQDNINYIPVATVKAKGNSTITSYSQLVKQPAALVYYRLKMIDNNGSYTYSRIAVCRTRCNITEYMTVYPNPVVEASFINLSFGTAYKGKAVLLVMSAIGQRLFSIDIQVNTFTNVIPVNVAKLPSATYYINLVSDKGERIGTVQKFIKQ